MFEKEKHYCNIHPQLNSVINWNLGKRRTGMVSHSESWAGDNGGGVRSWQVAPLTLLWLHWDRDRRRIWQYFLRHGVSDGHHPAERSGQNAEKKRFGRALRQTGRGKRHHDEGAQAEIFTTFNQSCDHTNSSASAGYQICWLCAVG